jgi:hypothetical protein
MDHWIKDTFSIPKRLTNQYQYDGIRIFNSITVKPLECCCLQ